MTALAVVVGCQGPPKTAALPPAKPKPPSVSVAAPPPPRPEPAAAVLRTGRWEPVEDAKVSLHVVRRDVKHGIEFDEIGLPTATELAGSVSLGSTTVVELAQPGGSLAFIGAGSPPAPVPGAAARASELRLWVRRPATVTSPALAGTFYTAASRSAHGHRVPFVASPDKDTGAAPDLERAWASALATDLETRSSAFYRFASERVRQRYLREKPKKDAPRDGYHRDDGLEDLMDTTTGRLSVQDALERDRSLFIEAEAKTRSVPVEKLKPPQLTSHPWADLARALPARPPEEPLAKATPAEFYFLRARGLGRLLDIVDAVESWGEPAANALDGRTEDRGTFERYETELGLVRTDATRMFGPQLVTDLAVVGSDPYIHEGTDVTLLLHVTDAAIFATAIAGLASASSANHGAVTETQFDHEGVTVIVRRSADGRLRQHWASVGDLELVSNSAGAIERVISTIHGHHPRLSDEPDFLYMLARDAEAPDDVLAYLGDRFVATVVGPQQKIAEARRQLALADLSRPGYAALLYGWIEGHAPASLAELVGSKLLDASELRHPGGGAIDWRPRTGAHSTWGSPAALEPLIDLPKVTLVTEPEERGYESFAQSYESLWSDKIDPMAFRIRDEKIAGRTKLTADLRVLPLLRREYRDVLSVAGTAKTVVPNVSSGARVVLGIGKDATLRRELTETGRSFGGEQPLAFDWIGDYGVVGVADRNELANTALMLASDDIEMPLEPAHPKHEETFEELADLPIYAAIEVRSRLGAAVALTALHELADKSAPGAATWGKAASYRGNDIVAVTDDEAHQKITVYYSLLPSALVVSLNEGTLHVAINQLLDAPPVSAPGGSNAADAAQLSLDVTGTPTGALYRALVWCATAEALDSPNDSAALAEAVFRGVPESEHDAGRARAALRAAFGVVPLTVDGFDFSWGPDGIRDPARGSANAPVWPDVPVHGSILDKLKLRRLRAAVSFDDEPGQTSKTPFQSLHARLAVQLD